MGRAMGTRIAEAERAPLTRMLELWGGVSRGMSRGSRRPGHVARQLHDWPALWTLRLLLNTSLNNIRFIGRWRQVCNVLFEIDRALPYIAPRQGEPRSPLSPQTLELG